MCAEGRDRSIAWSSWPAPVQGNLCVSKSKVLMVHSHRIGAASGVNDPLVEDGKEGAIPCRERSGLDKFCTVVSREKPVM